MRLLRESRVAVALLQVLAAEEHLEELVSCRNSNRIENWKHVYISVWNLNEYFTLKKTSFKLSKTHLVKIQVSPLTNEEHFVSFDLNCANVVASQEQVQI